MNTRALLLFLCCVATQWTAGHTASKADKGYVLYAMAPEDRGSYFVNERSGHYNYGYNTGDGIAKVEVSQPDGSIVGSYRYFDPNGKQVVRSYVADSKGFRVLGNDLPISPDTPVSHLAGLPALTGAVEGTEAFKIPPPLRSTAHTSEHQRAQYQQLLKEQHLSEQQQTQYEKQHYKLEALRRRIKELEALQREVSTNYYSKRYYTHSTPHLSVRNHLTHGYTSPYRYFERDMHYDFPAGFAYSGLPTIVDRHYETSYPQSTYIIGMAR